MADAIERAVRVNAGLIAEEMMVGSDAPKDEAGDEEAALEA